MKTSTNLYTLFVGPVSQTNQLQAMNVFSQMQINLLPLQKIYFPVQIFRSMVLGEHPLTHLKFSPAHLCAFSDRALLTSTGEPVQQT